MATDNIYAPQDPTKQYPRPPFKKQQQDAPGTIHDMDPQPDHGEKSYIGSDRLAGRKAIVTGADSGIGRAVAIAFAREGADVAINFLPEEADQGQEVADLISQAGRTVAVIPGDLKDEAFNVELVERAVSELGGLDIIAFVAGTMPTIASVADFDTSTFDDILKTNLYSMFWITKAALPHLKPGSSIVTTSSQQAFKASPQLVEYAVSKAGIANWTRGMSAQLVDKGIRVNGVAPGPVWTPLQPSFVPNEKIESFGSEAPMGRPGQPAELAPAFVFLASQESSYVTGETIAVTGGTLLH
jgi:NAD(P)-dependent dehydrogenase (short-subunit alcohol dehydrogenase family)